jgi:hypothetical protein
MTKNELKKMYLHEALRTEQVPALTDVATFDLAKASEFVEFWSQFYDYRVTVFGSKQEIDYFSELNIGNDLTAENVRRLLRWKDWQRLSERILSGPNEGHENPRVMRVLANLGTINQFRKDQATNGESLQILADMFPNGAIWGAFLLHIAKPNVYPIGDQNVFRAWSLHKGLEAEQNWETYVAYRDYFREIATALGITETIGNVRELKRIDNALFVFGQFLKAYHPRFATKLKKKANGVLTSTSTRSISTQI